ncbi:hypothetical protein EMPS_02204 [Entomortierella parvispora]|uniref:Uncharacterized protein n=1 Tax=Entomortierella parvispora TaxID=205924 RepID=A0A9P3H498_9FUNG|nr:hypothetical protein EMPS_02204 [Entomortierella parvispora]
MMPWRPLGMLSFGLTIIYLFVRLHGDGYDFPVKVSENNDTIEHFGGRLPDRTFLEISPVYLAEQVLFTKESDFALSDPEEGTGAESDREEGQIDHGVKKALAKDGPAGLWQSQWRKMKGTKDGDASAQGPTDEAELDSLGSKGNEQQWIWMTNLWYDDGDCGPGHIRQYRRPLDRALTGDNSSTWDLMYTHKLPGPIVHASLSKRVFPTPRKPTRSSSAQGQDQRQDEEIDVHREVIRLAVVFKVVQDEHVAYHSRIYHYGVFHSGKVDLRADCASMSTETCHSQVPFQTFDYVLPGSTAIKDFSLEHDSILYSRLSDTVYFRSLQLPQLQPGSTTPERPYALSYGSPGPTMKCDEKRNTPYRMSFLTQLQSYPLSEESHILMGKVVENRDTWEYHMMVATKVSEMMTGNKKWLSDSRRWDRYQQLLQENDMINDDAYVHGDSVQRPYMVKSSDGYSIHIPVKNKIRSLDIRHPPLPSHQDGSSPQHYRESNWQEDDDGRRNGRFKNKMQFENNNYNQYKIADRKLDSSGKLSDRFVMPSTNLMDRWTYSVIDAGLESVDTEQGVLNDRSDVMVLKTARNDILVLRRSLDDATYPTSRSNWELSMAMGDKGFLEMSPMREVLAMKIVRAPVPVKSPPPSESLTMEGASEEEAGERSSVQDSESPTPEQETPVRYHDVLLLVYGKGWLKSFDLDQPAEFSATLQFFEEKYHVVIGMLAVVIAFVINEAR